MRVYTMYIVGHFLATKVKIAGYGMDMGDHRVG